MPRKYQLNEKTHQTVQVAFQKHQSQPQKKTDSRTSPGPEVCTIYQQDPQKETANSQ